MKANELMIGDWVQSDDKPYKYYAPYLNLDNDLSDGCWIVDSDSQRYFTGLTDIKPILLTAEILEKNGFKKRQIYGQKQDDIFQCLDGEIVIEVGLYDPNFILINYHYQTPDEIQKGELSSIVKVDGAKFYLHELQHALKLCGIDKEIVL